jgi:hypothetical protein
VFLLKKIFSSVFVICLLILSLFSVVDAAQIDPAQKSLTLAPNQSAQFNLKVTIGAVPISKIDVVFAMDLTGSMEDELSIVKSDAISIMNGIRSLVPDSNFGVVSFMDYRSSYSYPGYYNTPYGSGIDYPFLVNLQPTNDTASVSSAINGLAIGDGQDAPEDYSRVLYESLSLNWRPLTVKIIILIGDAPTHDLNFAGYNNGGDPGRDGIAQTADDLGFVNVVRLVNEAKITVLAVQGSADEPERTQAEATFKGMSIGFAGAGGTNGEYFQLSNANQIPIVISNMVSTTILKIKHLTLGIPINYKNWISYAPHEFVNVGPNTSNIFEVNVTAPSGSSGSNSLMINVLGDDSLLGTCEVNSTILQAQPINQTTIKPDAPLLTDSIDIFWWAIAAALIVASSTTGIMYFMARKTLLSLTKTNVLAVSQANKPKTNQICGTCGASNLTGARFCKGCGKKL